jgi:hypothetical protein
MDKSMYIRQAERQKGREAERQAGKDFQSKIKILALDGRKKSSFFIASLKIFL